MSDTRRITLSVNGRSRTEEVETRIHLADFLRQSLGLTGTHLGCEHGVCGACTIIVDGRAVRSCLMLAVQADGAEIETVENLGRVEALSPLQKAFSTHHGLQCGFCTPGMLMSIEAFLRENPEPTAADIREAISGNICRCTGYQGIVEAALAAADERRGRA
ncbi:MAG: aerobic carbon-monoxide dehydrogenase small subunit [Methylobacteriaceae bacterium]|nr:aerobic carbon-monoxide dehydrogenase small subunit [Methylobacteriaceae bacterium]